MEEVHLVHCVKEDQFRKREGIEYEMTHGNHDHVPNAVSTTVTTKSLGETFTGSRWSVGPGGGAEGRTGCRSV
jgi:hypothetical protein